MAEPLTVAELAAAADQLGPTMRFAWQTLLRFVETQRRR